MKTQMSKVAFYSSLKLETCLSLWLSPGCFESQCWETDPLTGSPRASNVFLLGFLELPHGHQNFLFFKTGCLTSIFFLKVDYAMRLLRVVDDKNNIYFLNDVFAWWRFKPPESLITRIMESQTWSIWAWDEMFEEFLRDKTALVRIWKVSMVSLSGGRKGQRLL